MNFEIAPPEYFKKLTLSDSQLYCFSLNIEAKTGWRLPTNEEYEDIITYYVNYATGWDQDDVEDTYPQDRLHYCYPVRDLP
jgi:hypothetical protein